MLERPLVSAIIIFYNPPEEFFREAIASVFAQTYDRWELLLVDDGSTNGTSEIAQAFARSQPNKVRYLHHEGQANKGMSATRNLGIAHARGECIAFLDADDVWLRQKIEHQVAILAVHPEVSMVFGSSLYWHSWTGKTRALRRDFIPELGVTPDTVQPPPLLLVGSYPLGSINTPCPSD